MDIIRKIVGYQGERRIVSVTDDDTNNRDVLMNMLLPLGFKVVEAENRQDCIEKTVKYHLDPLLLDLRMPVLDGFETTQHIREVESSQTQIHIPIIAVFAWHTLWIRDCFV